MPGDEGCAPQETKSTTEGFLFNHSFLNHCWRLSLCTMSESFSVLTVSMLQIMQLSYCESNTIEFDNSRKQIYSKLSMKYGIKIVLSCHAVT